MMIFWTCKSTASHRNLLHKVLPWYAPNYKAKGISPLNCIREWTGMGKGHDAEGTQANDFKFGWGRHWEWHRSVTPVTQVPLGIRSWNDSVESDYGNMWVVIMLHNVCTHMVTLFNKFKKVPCWTEIVSHLPCRVVHVNLRGHSFFTENVPHFGELLSWVCGGGWGG